MASLKDIRTRIDSVKRTQKTTSAMKMVSAAKLKKSQDKMQNIKPFSQALQHSIQNLLPTISSSEIKLLSSFATNDKI